MSEVDRRVAELEGLPRKNGELVFEAPWQGRAFGMAVALNEQGSYEWDDFRRHLVEEIGEQPDRDYYASWLDAFQHLVLERRLLSPEELDRRTAEFLAMERDEVF
jgi:nitrile hydratase accessory protein